MRLPPSIKDMMDELSKLPGIGAKTAQRLTIQILKKDKNAVEKLASAIATARQQLRYCQECWNWSEDQLCAVCADPERDRTTLCVVEEVLDLMAIENTGEYKGLYHVLHGAIAPLDGVGPEQLTIEPLLTRIQSHPWKEVILATNTSLEGEATAMYLFRHLQKPDLTVTRLAKGIPMGGGLEYADDRTLGISIKRRSAF